MPIHRVSQPKTLEPCVACGRLIYKNVIFVDGKPWHYGELYPTGRLSEVTHYCRDCGSHLTPDMVARITDGDGYSWRACGVCGSSNIIRRREAEASY